MSAKENSLLQSAMFAIDRRGKLGYLTEATKHLTEKRSKIQNMEISEIFGDGVVTQLN